MVVDFIKNEHSNEWFAVFVFCIFLTVFMNFGKLKYGFSD